MQVVSQNDKLGGISWIPQKTLRVHEDNREWSQFLEAEQAKFDAQASAKSDTNK